MRATSLGHAGILIESEHGSILCDPWFVPAFFGSWFPFPRNDQLGEDLLDRIETADHLYVSHLHGDHWDEPWLRDHLPRDIPVLLPGYPTRELDRKMRALGFTELVRTTDGEELSLGALTVAIHMEASITDGPGGDSALVVSDGRARIVDQNDCRPSDLDALRAHGPVDLHWLQYSGAIWYPMVYDLAADDLHRLVEAKIDSQLARAMRYVESVAARAVVPSAGPPCFLDPELFHLNVVRGDEPSIFVDQRVFLDRLARSGHVGLLAIPGTTIEVGPGELDVAHPCDAEDVEAIFADKGTYLKAYQADWLPWIDDVRASWRHRVDTDLLSTLRSRWEPLLELAPTVREAIGAGCLLRADDLDVFIDFPVGEVRAWAGEAYRYRFDIERSLIETVVGGHHVDWSNALFLSCRFRAWREGAFNEWVYNFFKSLSPERMRRAEAEAVRRLHPPTEEEPDIELGDWIVQRRCPHRSADLAVFAEIDGCVLTCTLHGWRFDLETGRCLTAADRPLRVRPRDERAQRAHAGRASASYMPPAQYGDRGPGGAAPRV